MRKPFVHISPDHVVLDELHPLLRVTDVLTNNVIKDAMERDSREGTKKPLEGKRLQRLIKAINACGVTFNICTNRMAMEVPVTVMTGHH